MTCSGLKLGSFSAWVSFGTAVATARCGGHWRFFCWPVELRAEGWPLDHGPRLHSAHPGHDLALRPWKAETFQGRRSFRRRRLGGDGPLRVLHRATWEHDPF